MKNKNNLRNMMNRFLRSTRLGSVLFLFLGLFFSLTVKSQNCQVLDSVIITDVTCFGDNDGVIHLYPTTGYDFFWNTTATTDSIHNMQAGTYSVTITDQLDPTCYLDTFFVISGPQDPVSVVVNLGDDVKCFGDSTGIANAENAIGGTAPYTYLWDNGQTTQQADELWAGTHIVTVTDANGCTAQASIDIVNLYDPITGNIDIMTDSLYTPYSISCFGACDAVVSFSAEGGDNIYTYSWDFGQVYNGTGNDTATSLCYGGHNILVEDGLGCRETFTFTLTQPDELFASAIMHQPVRCFGEDNGMALANGAQGTTPYTFAWDSLNGFLGMDTTSNQISGNLIDSLTPGIHTVYITDANGCVASDTVMITEPPLLEVEIIDSLAVYAYCSNTNSGELCAVATGGTPNYLYTWNDVLGQTTACAYNLVAQAAEYTITVIDERYCEATASFDLDSTTNSMNPDSVVITQVPISCFGEYDGQLTVSNVVGGVGPYSYSWNGPASYTGNGVSISSLYHGFYGVLISDVNGCEVSSGTYLNEPVALTYDIYNTVDETCAGSANGQIWVNVEGGTGSYYYDSTEDGWDPDLDTTALVQLINDSLIFNVSPGGLDTIYITDDNGCEGAVTFGTGSGGFATAAIGTVVTVPVPSLDVINPSTSCYNTNDGAAVVVDPDPLFTYTWELEDPANLGNPDGIDISNGAGTAWGAFSHSVVYFLVAHYADSASFGIPYSGCDNDTLFTISSGTTPIIVTETITDVSCFGYADGEVELNISGGNSPYELVWDTTTTNPSGQIVVASNYTFDNLTIGDYAVSVTDANGCVTMESYQIEEPLPLISDIIPTHVTCFGKDDGEAEVNIVTGTGTGIDEYVWLPSGTAGLNDDVATDLGPGLYTVTVTDNQGCQYTDSVYILEPANPVTEVQAEDLYVGEFDVSCYGEDDGAAFATGSGFSFEWFDDNGNSIGTGQHITGLEEGDYKVVAEGPIGCYGDASIYISEPDELEVDVEESEYGGGYQISCYGLDDGWAEVDIEGGVPFGTDVNGADTYYDIEWEDEDGYDWPGDIIAYNLEAGHYYTVTVTDANGCEDDATTMLYTEPIEFIANVTTLNYPGPLHGPVNISFIDSTESDEEYDFDWYWNYEIGDDDPDYELNDVDESDNQIFTNEFGLWDSDNDGDDDFVSQEDWMNTYNVLVALENEKTFCKDTVEFTIEVQGVPELPDVFTPNNDGFNDSFSFSEFEMKSIDVQIFNRWGQLVYAWKGPDRAWTGVGIDGQEVAEGVYFYAFVAEGVDGHYYDKKGTITLLR